MISLMHDIFFYEISNFQTNITRNGAEIIHNYCIYLCFPTRITSYFLTNLCIRRFLLPTAPTLRQAVTEWVEDPQWPRSQVHT